MIEAFCDGFIMDILTVLIRNIILFWIAVCIVATAIYCTTRLVSYAIYKSKLQVYFNLKTEEEQNGKGQKRKEKITGKKS